jgi:MFS family permease
MESEHRQGPPYDAPRNFWLFVANGAITQGSIGFIAFETVLAGLAYKLTQSAFLVGLMISAAGVGMLWPQVFVGSFIEHRRRKKPVYASVAAIRVLALISMAGALMVWEGGDLALYWTLFGIFILFTTFGGVAIVPFMDVMAKAVSTRRRPLIFALRRLLGGLFGAGGGMGAMYVLSERSGLAYPANYALLLVIGGLGSGLGFLCFILTVEPIEPVPPRSGGLLRFLRRGPKILAGDADYRRFYLFKCAWGVMAMSNALLVPSAMELYGAPEAMTGNFTTILMGVGGVTALICGMAASRYGEVITLRAGTWLLLGMPLLGAIMTLGAWAEVDFLGRIYLPVYVVMYAMFAAGLHGTQMSGMVYLMSMSPPARLPSYFGFMNALSVPLVLLPSAAGFLAQTLSYPAAFGVSFVSGLIALRLAYRLNHRRPEDAPDVIGEIEGALAAGKG